MALNETPYPKGTIMLKNRLPKVKAFVRESALPLTYYAVGVGVGVLVTVNYYHGKTLLEITQTNVDRLKEVGGGFIYETNLGDVLLTIPGALATKE